VPVDVERAPIATVHNNFVIVGPVLAQDDLSPLLEHLLQTPRTEHLSFWWQHATCKADRTGTFQQNALTNCAARTRADEHASRCTVKQRCAAVPALLLFPLSPFPVSLIGLRLGKDLKRCTATASLRDAGHTGNSAAHLLRIPAQHKQRAPGRVPALQGRVRHTHTYGMLDTCSSHFSALRSRRQTKPSVAYEAPIRSKFACETSRPSKMGGASPMAHENAAETLYHVSYPVVTFEHVHGPRAR
jgi:hypothetical protein